MVSPPLVKVVVPRWPPMTVSVWVMPVALDPITELRLHAGAGVVQNRAFRADIQLTVLIPGHTPRRWEC